MMILFYKLAINSEGTRFRLLNITTKLLLFSIISFLTKKVNILCLDIFKWTSVMHRGHGLNTSRFISCPSIDLVGLPGWILVSIIQKLWSKILIVYWLSVGRFIPGFLYKS